MRLYRKRSRQRHFLSEVILLLVFSRVLNQLGEPISVLAIAPASARARRRKYQTITGRVYLNCCFRARRVVCEKSWKHDLARGDPEFIVAIGRSSPAAVRTRPRN
jgi:hypothetical protein